MTIGGILLTVFMIILPGKSKVEENPLRMESNASDYFSVFQETVNATEVTDIDLFGDELFSSLSPDNISESVFEVTTLDSLERFGNKSEEKSDNNKLLNANWPVKHSSEVPGDLILGGLMMVHEREDSITCGPVMPQGGVQALETMLYTLDEINQRGILPNFTIGTHILDDCDKDTYGLEMAVDFIKGKSFRLFNSIREVLIRKQKKDVHVI